MDLFDVAKGSYATVYDDELKAAAEVGDAKPLTAYLLCSLIGAKFLPES